MHSGHSLTLAVHLLGVVMLSGAVVGGMLTDRALWARFAIDPKAGGVLAPLLRSIAKLAGAGSGVMLLSGIGLLAHGKWAYWGAPWLTVKLVLFVLLGLNGMIVGAPSGRKLSALCAAAEAGASLPQAEVAQVRARRKWFHLSEVGLFVLAVVMAALKIS